MEVVHDSIAVEICLSESCLICIKLWLKYGLDISALFEIYSKFPLENATMARIYLYYFNGNKQGCRYLYGWVATEITFLIRAATVVLIIFWIKGQKLFGYHCTYIYTCLWNSFLSKSRMHFSKRDEYINNMCSLCFCKLPNVSIYVIAKKNPASKSLSLIYYQKVL